VEAAKGDEPAEGYSVARTLHFRAGQVVARCGKCKTDTPLPLQVRVMFGRGAADEPPAA
jgi:hypothetical protein